MSDFPSDAHDTLGLFIYSKEKENFSQVQQIKFFKMLAMRRLIKVRTYKIEINISARTVNGRHFIIGWF